MSRPPHSRGLSIWFQVMEEAAQSNRIHMGDFVPHDQAEASIAAAPAWWTLANAEGNEVEVATWSAATSTSARSNLVDLRLPPWLRR